MMKAEDIRAMSDDQLKSKLLDLRKEQMNLRFQKATGQLEKPHAITAARKTVARIKTELSARKSA